MPDEVSQGLGEFLDYYWHDDKGYVYLATLDKGLNFKQYMIEWPAKRRGVIQHILRESAEGKDVYYSPVVYKDRRPTKENVLGSRVIWTEFDPSKGTNPGPDDWSVYAKEKGIPEPTRVIQSSVPGHQHAYWELEEFTTDVEAIEDRNRALAYRLGGDTGSWDADQLLRPPFTTNYGYKGGGDRKPWYEGESKPVNVIKASTDKVGLSQFETLGTPEREYLDNLTLGELPTLAEVLAYGKWDREFLESFAKTKEQVEADGDRSGAIMRLGYFGAEHGFTDEQIYVILDDADKRWGKYTARSKAGREKLLRDIIARARAKHGYPTGETLTFAGLTGASPVAPQDIKTVYNFKEFLDTEIIIDWMVEKLLAQGGFGIITGMPGVGKTQFGIQLAITLALGLDHFLIWDNNTGPKKVLFLSLEMPHAPLKHFLDQIAPLYPEVQTLARNLHIAPIGSAIPLDTPQGQAFVDNLLSEYKPDVLFIDSLQKMTNKELTDELSAKALTTYLQQIREKHGTSIYVVHHNRKKSNDAQHQAGSLSEMYGSQFLAADVDFVVNLRKLGDSRIISVDCWKNRLAEEWRTFEIQRNQYLQYEQYNGGLNGGVSPNGIFIEPSRRGDSDGEGEGRSFLSL